MKVANPLAKNVLPPLEITAAASATDAGTQKKIHGSGTITLIISKKEMTWWFLSMLLGTLGASLSGNILAGKGVVRLVIEKNGIFNATSSFNKLWITKISKWTKI